ncbi:peptidase M48 [Moraxella caviae]|uniref:Peptidase M48 n=1 Tax=Moraxella caviae TaxID=34060 RepID=A0A1T0A131_9GAMM|nr:M48 family metallopeptidase [Moraxella caviae]OOR89483.1 peptidase M48 [Moraxella caviae]STZ09824.1 Uncharacterized metalloprotease yggG [Moraxella caviae]
MSKFRSTLLTAALAGTVALTGCASTTTGGVVGADRKQLLLLSSDQIMQISSETYQKTIKQARSEGKLDTNAAMVARLKRIANRLIPHTAVYRADAPSWDWKIHAIKDDTINAYVMPGGKIVFYHGIIEKLNLTDDEIAAIMGHEMAHALREHSREKASRQMVTGNVLNIAVSAFGLSSGQAQLAGLAGALGLTLPNSRTAEAEADKIGLELMARAGYNPQAAVTLWEKMQRSKTGNTPQFLSTHPSSQNRINALQQLVPTVLPLYNATR